jgi:hypothetical protein
MQGMVVHKCAMADCCIDLELHALLAAFPQLHTGPS